jgi:hypothetical protein
MADKWVDALSYGFGPYEEATESICVDEGKCLYQENCTCSQDTRDIVYFLITERMTDE